jgi:hypothetical protein
LEDQVSEYILSVGVVDEVITPAGPKANNKETPRSFTNSSLSYSSWP